MQATGGGGENAAWTGTAARRGADPARSGCLLHPAGGGPNTARLSRTTPGRTTSRQDRAMERFPVSSSLLKSVGYDSDGKLLEVEFRSLAVYAYWEVPLWAYEGLMTARSKGRYFDARIRDRYPFQRVG